MIIMSRYRPLYVIVMVGIRAATVPRTPGLYDSHATAI